jgi:hypothetical protein
MADYQNGKGGRTPALKNIRIALNYFPAGN